MNWTRCSKGTIAVALVVVLLGATGTAAALSVSASNTPEEAEVDSEINTTITIDDAFTENSEWTLETETELENVSWTVEEYDQNSRIEQWTGGGETFSQEVSSDPEGDEIRIRVTGDVPAVDEYNYSHPANFTFVAVKSTTGDNTQTLETYRVHHYTTASKEARTAIDNAKKAIDEAGGNDDAESDLQSAVDFYDSGQFDAAKREAGNAEDKATQAKQSQQTTQMLLFGGLGVVLLAAVVGGVWYYRQQQDDYDKLR